jgi:tyrosine decarboxylase/aspartate 1-decarboxylase
LERAEAELELLREAVARLAEGFAELPPHGEEGELDDMRDVLLRVAERLHDNYPYEHPLYAGQMLKPPHAIARLAYQLAMWINPNNHALDGGRASSAMEREAVARIAAMFGMEEHLGHLTSGGTFANLEALWVAGRLHPGKKIAASGLAHYTHSRISAVLGLDCVELAYDERGHIDLAALEGELAQGEIGTIVVTLGTTGLGSVDDLGGVQAIAHRHGVRVHVDAAYGGYFALAGNLGMREAQCFEVIGTADSIVIDPHKHGLQPYGCGCVLFRDPSVGRFYKHDSPYTYFSSAELHLGEISLECSRAGAAAVALWATQEYLPYEPGGDFASMLESCVDAARDLCNRLAEDPQWRVLMPPELDILVFAPACESAEETSRRSREVFEAAALEDLHLALFQVPGRLIDAHWPELGARGDSVTCLRSCLMKAEHLGWTEEIHRRLGRALR